MTTTVACATVVVKKEMIMKTKFSGAELKAQRMAARAIEVRGRAEHKRAMKNPLYRARVEFEHDGQRPFIPVVCTDGVELYFKIFNVKRILPDSHIAAGTIKRYGEVIEGRVVLTAEQVAGATNSPILFKALHGDEYYD